MASRNDPLLRMECSADAVFAHDAEVLEKLLRLDDFVGIADVSRAKNSSASRLPIETSTAVKLIASTFDAAFQLPCLRDVNRRVLFRAVRGWALDHLRKPGQPWRKTKPGGPEQDDTIEYTAAECRGALANAFLGNVLDPMAPFKRPHRSGLDFLRHYACGAEDPLGVNKTAALLLYFEQARQLAGTEDDTRKVRFVHRRGLALDDFERLLEGTTAPVVDRSAAISLQQGSMEEPENVTGFVNFANAIYGVGDFFNSCTQEEILQMACPEFNVGMLHVGTMADDEVVVVRNCRRFINYSGYGGTFAVVGPWDSSRRNTVTDILTMDASFCNHFERSIQVRDTRKAYTAFCALGSGARISTGRLGCGAFGGLPAHKFAQQAVAAKKAGVQLQFSTFGDPEGCDVVLELLERSGCHVAEFWHHLSSMRSAKSYLLQLRTLLSSDAVGREGSMGNGYAASSNGKGKGKGPPPPPAREGGARRQSNHAPPPAVRCAGIGEVCLRPTETRVRQRDGTIMCEKRSTDGEGFEAVVVGMDTSKPQYVLDQEAGLSRLQPKVFDSDARRWVVQTAAELAMESDEACGALRLLSYNVWFSEHRQHARAEALFAILEQEDADIVCLQEVTPPFLGWLCQQEWARGRYAVSDVVGTTLKGSSLVYGVLMLIRRRLVVRSICLHALPTSMNRAVLVASLSLGELQMRVATVHLESLNNAAVRMQQLERILGLLTMEGSDGRCTVILAGDMNFDDGSPEEAVVQKHGFGDCWLACAPASMDKADHVQLGITMPEDDFLDVSTRIDRVFLGPSPQGEPQRLTVSQMHRLGIESTVTKGSEGMQSDRPSDHFGLCCNFTVQGMLV